MRVAVPPAVADTSARRTPSDYDASYRPAGWPKSVRRPRAPKDSNDFRFSNTHRGSPQKPVESLCNHGDASPAAAACACDATALQSTTGCLRAPRFRPPLIHSPGQFFPSVRALRPKSAAQAAAIQSARFRRSPGTRLGRASLGSRTRNATSAQNSSRMLSPVRVVEQHQTLKTKRQQRRPTDRAHHNRHPRRARARILTRKNARQISVLGQHTAAARTTSSAIQTCRTHRAYRRQPRPVRAVCREYLAHVHPSACVHAFGSSPVRATRLRELNKLSVTSATAPAIASG